MRFKTPEKKQKAACFNPSKGLGTKRPEVANAAPLISSMGGVSAKDSALEGCLLGKIKMNVIHKQQ